MSKENFKKFMEDVKNNSQLGEEMKQHVSAANNEDEMIKFTADFINKKGYNVSIEDVKDLYFKMKSGQLDEDDLEDVAGGDGFLSGLWNELKNVGSDFLQGGMQNLKNKYMSNQQQQQGGNGGGQQQ